VSSSFFSTSSCSRSTGQQHKSTSIRRTLLDSVRWLVLYQGGVPHATAKMSSSISDMFDVQDPEQAAKLALVLFAIGLGIAIIGFALSVHQNDGTILFIYRIERLPPRILVFIRRIILRIFLFRVQQL